MRAVRRRDRRGWYVAVAIFAAVFLFVFLRGVNSGKEVEVGAASLAEFDPGYIISDYQMGRYDSMTEAEIQKFLTSKNSCGNRSYSDYKWLSENSVATWHFKDGHFVCLSEELFGDGEVIGSGETAAHIIWQAAQDYKINPQVIMVLLQKETSLITDPIPNNYDYRKAVGYGCPDTAACSSKYYGFKNQVRNAAALFRTVLDGGWTNYPLGNNYVQYNPSAACGGSMVNIRSLATSALYRYTPYQPNASAIAAGYGYGDECGAYGNRNFYLYFQDWFGGIREENLDKGDSVGNVLIGSHIIHSALSDSMVLDIAGGAETAMNGTNIQLWQANNTAAQIWEFIYHTEDDTYTLVNPYTGKALDVKSASMLSGANIQLWEQHDTCAQRWSITNENNYYIFRSACSDKVLDVSGANIASGTNIQIWDFNGTSAQKWVLMDVNWMEEFTSENIYSGYYNVGLHFDNSMVLDIAGGAETAMNGTNIQLWQANNTAAQIWEFIYHTEDDTYTLVNPYTGKALDVKSASMLSGANIQLWEQHDTCAQRWSITNENNYYIFRSACSDKVLDVSGANIASGTNIQIWDFNGTSAQKWVLE